MGSSDRKTFLPCEVRKLAASGPARHRNRRPGARILKIGPCSRYWRTRNDTSPFLMASPLPSSGSPGTTGISFGRAGLGGGSSRASISPIARLIVRPIRSRLVSRSIPSRTSARSSADRRVRKTPQACASAMIGMSRGAGTWSLNSTRITRSLTSSICFPSAVGYRLERDTEGTSDRTPCASVLRIPRSIRRAVAARRIPSPRPAIRSSQWAVSRCSPSPAMSASAGSRRSSPSGVESTTISRWRSVSIRSSSARSISTAPASARLSALAGRAGASSPRPSSSTRTRIFLGQPQHGALLSVAGVRRAIRAGLRPGGYEKLVCAGAVAQTAAVAGDMPARAVGVPRCRPPGVGTTRAAGDVTACRSAGPTGTCG